MSFWCFTPSPLPLFHTTTPTARPCPQPRVPCNARLGLPRRNIVILATTPAVYSGFPSPHAWLHRTHRLTDSAPSLQSVSLRNLYLPPGSIRPKVLSFGNLSPLSRRIRRVSLRSPYSPRCAWRVPTLSYDCFDALSLAKFACACRD